MAWMTPERAKGDWEEKDQPSGKQTRKEWEETRRKSDGVDKGFLKVSARPEELDKRSASVQHIKGNSDGTAHEQTDVEAMQESTDRCCAALVDLDEGLQQCATKI